MSDGASAADPARFASFATEIVREAGAGIARRFSDGSYSVDAKEDGTPVTEADREAEEFLRERIARTYPSHGVIGEEFGTEGADREYVWVLDPIDGTKSFVHGVPLFGTLVGLLHRGRPILGVIHQPVLDRTAVGDNRSATVNGRPAVLRPARSLASATLLCTDPSDPAFLAAGAPFLSLLEEAGIVRTWGDCFGYLMLVSGRADVMIDPVLEPWDVLPLLPVLRGAGVSVAGLDGGAPEESGSLVAASCPALRERVLGVFGDLANDG